jgi:hypothetical protein
MPVCDMGWGHNAPGYSPEKQDNELCDILSPTRRASKQAVIRFFPCCEFFSLIKDFHSQL